jgi:hypothetical protein
MGFSMVSHTKMVGAQSDMRRPFVTADALDDRRPKLAEALAKARKAKAPVVSAAYPAMWRSFPVQWTSGCRSS